MKLFILVLLALVVIPGLAFAYTDIGLLKNQKTISYFLLSPTDSTGLSSGLIYNQKQNEKMALEITGTAYKSAYLITNNITKIRIDEKYKFFQYGPLGLTGLAGAVLLYSPSLGLGLAGDVGGILSLNFTPDFGAALSLNGIIFRDGIEVDIEPAVYVVPGFARNSEIYAGFRVEGSMVGYSFDGSSGGGKFNTYINAGVRVGL